MIQAAKVFEVVVPVDVEQVIDDFTGIVVLLFEPLVESVVVHLVDVSQPSRHPAGPSLEALTIEEPEHPLT